MGSTIKVETVKAFSPLSLDEEVTAILKENQQNNCHVQFRPLIQPSGTIVYMAMVEVRSV